MWHLEWGHNERYRHNLNNFGKRHVDDVIYTKYESFGPCSVRQDCLNLHFLKLFSVPVTYLCIQWKLFEQLWKMTIWGSFLWSLDKIHLAVSKKMFKWKCWLTTHNRQWTKTGSIAHPKHFVLKWAKKEIIKKLYFLVTNK